MFIFALSFDNGGDQYYIILFCDILLFLLLLLLYLYMFYGKKYLYILFIFYIITMSRCD